MVLQQLLRFLLGATFLATLAVAQPKISAIENNYCFIDPGFPGYGIAQGSIFAIFGSSLARSTVPLQQPPLRTALNGVSVTFTVGGTSTHALHYYATPAQICQILPSATPSQ